MTTPADWPPTVAPGNTISDTWGNQVVAGFRMAPAYIRGKKTGIPIAGTDNQLDLTGATGLVDPRGLLTAAGILVPTIWVGLWSVSAQFSGGYPYSEVKVWFEHGSNRYGELSSGWLLGHGIAASGQSSTTIIPVTTGETYIEFHFNVVDANTPSVDVEFAAHWIGPV